MQKEGAWSRNSAGCVFFNWRLIDGEEFCEVWLYFSTAGRGLLQLFRTPACGCARALIISERPVALHKRACNSGQAWSKIHGRFFAVHRAKGFISTIKGW